MKVRDPIGDEVFIRVVGKRVRSPVGRVPPRGTRQALSKMAAYRTRAPKGVFIYSSHEAANRARERWQIEAAIAGEATLPLSVLRHTESSDGSPTTRRRNGKGAIVPSPPIEG